MKRVIGLFVALAGALLIQLQQGSVQVSAQAPDALKFFKNYFITGDYAVGGVGLRGLGVNGLATGSIAMSGVPKDVDIAAAFLYWQVVAKDSVRPGRRQPACHFPGTPAQVGGRSARESARRRHRAVLEFGRRHRLIRWNEPDIFVPRRCAPVPRCRRDDRKVHRQRSAPGATAGRRRHDRARRQPGGDLPRPHGPAERDR